ncbi:MAG: phosphatidylserine synthase [Saprospiraceae bacterium]|nr:MAG: phosphatidylserine synthase [Saprospiraceae bacterium]
MKKHIPNIITLINLFLGCCALASIMYGLFVQAFLFSLASGVADFLDGSLARWLRVKSAFGKQLDSLADMVSFGVVPGAVLYMLLVKGMAGRDVLPIQLTIAAAPAFLVTLFAAIRLAIFNIDECQGENFLGMPTPSATLFCTGLMLIYHFDSFGLGSLVTEPLFLYTVIVSLSWLMVARFPMFGLKFRNLEWKGNQIRFIFAAFAILMIIVFKEASFSMIILAYLLFSTIDNYVLKH